MICYDIRFPELARYYFHKGVEMLLVPAQWPEVRSQHWRSLLRARAIENQMFVLGCNRTGHEASLKRGGDMLTFTGDGRIVDPTGEILASGTGESNLLIAAFEPRTARTAATSAPRCIASCSKRPLNSAARRARSPPRRSSPRTLRPRIQPRRTRLRPAAWQASGAARR
jgi:hypothetical protein